MNEQLKSVDLQNHASHNECFTLLVDDYSGEGLQAIQMIEQAGIPYHATDRISDIGLPRVGFRGQRFEYLDGVRRAIVLYEFLQSDKNKTDQ